MKSDIISSWEKNAMEWIKVIQNQSIPSRKFTNAAIVETIKNLKGKKIADIGCGEGWLTREMTASGWEATGMDAIASLISEAKTKGKEAYHVVTFEDIISGKTIPNAPFDAAVFNFCLYLKDDLVPLLQNTLNHLTDGGTVVIQTLHPFFLVQNGMPYKSQWLTDSWKGLPGNFEDGHSWYARTLEDWINELNGLQHGGVSIEEVINDEEKPISLIIKIKKA